LISPGFFSRLRSVSLWLVLMGVILSYLIAAGIASAAERRDNGEVAQVIYQVNVNTATADQLRLLYRTGEVIAARIIDERTAHGPYLDLEDLRNRVRGIGARWLACNADFVSFSGPTDLEAKISCPPTAEVAP
jgi:hypothetical protein